MHRARPAAGVASNVPPGMLCLVPNQRVLPSNGGGVVSFMTDHRAVHSPAAASGQVEFIEHGGLTIKTGLRFYDGTCVEARELGRQGHAKRKQLLNEIMVISCSVLQVL